MFRMNEATILDLNFKDEEGKNRKVTIKAPKADLTEEETKQAMQSIIDSKLCLNKGFISYFEMDGARYVTTAIDEVFKIEK